MSHDSRTTLEHKTPESNKSEERKVGNIKLSLNHMPFGLVYSLIGHRIGYSHSQEVSR
jgi:hypothetical protein